MTLQKALNKSPLLTYRTLLRTSFSQTMSTTQPNEISLLITEIWSDPHAKFEVHQKRVCKMGEERQIFTKSKMRNRTENKLNGDWLF